MKKTIKIALAILIIFVNLFWTNYSFADDIDDDDAIFDFFQQDSVEAGRSKLPNISAGAAIVMEVGSGRVLYEKNAYSRRSIASTTKIMTAIVAIENANYNENVVVSKRAACISGSQVNLKEGSTYKLGDLLYGLMLRSGNDAAIAIAEHVGGSVEAFAEMMNRKAAEIGAINTNFVTPHGLDDPQHYSTPYDLAIITQYALKNEKFSAIVGTKNSVFDGRPISNTNEMLSLYPGADGVKTGYTGQAGRCLVTTAKRDGMRIISVVLNCSSRAVSAQSSKSVLDYSFQGYKIHELLKKGDKIKNIKIHKGLVDNILTYTNSDVKLPLKQDEIDKVEIVYNLPEKIEAPIKSDSKVGTIDYILEGKLLATCDVICTDGVKRKDFYYYFNTIFRAWLGIAHQ